MIRLGEGRVLRRVIKKVVNKEVLVLIATCMEIGSYGFDLYSNLHGVF